MKKITAILTLLAVAMITSAQIAGRFYNCYKLDNESVTTTFLQHKKGPDTGRLTLSMLASDDHDNSSPTKIFFEIAFSPKFLNQTKNTTKPVLGKHSDMLLPADRIDSISLNFYYRGKPVGYKMHYNKSQNGYYVERKPDKSKGSYNSQAFLLHHLAAFKNKYNERDSLFTAGSLVRHNVLVVLKDSLPPVQQDFKAVFFIKFNDGRVIRKTM